MKLNKEIMERFFWWMNERHAIYLRRAGGQPHPWTIDQMLNDYKFTNVFRQLDRVTKYYQNNVYLPYQDRPAEEVLFNTCLFRAFNWPPTWEFMNPEPTCLPWHFRWSERRVERYDWRLIKWKSEGNQVFTGAYIITAGGIGKAEMQKHRFVLNSMTLVWNDRESIVKEIQSANTLEHACKVLRRYPTLGPFTSYEVACDLRYTHVLADPSDALTWANPGPGAVRGLRRIYGLPEKQKPAVKDSIEMMRELYKQSMTHWLYWKGWPLELREIEHSLCEFQKYERGFSRSRYRPPKTGQGELF